MRVYSNSDFGSGDEFLIRILDLHLGVLIVEKEVIAQLKSIKCSY